jgi:putative endonuclease
MLSKGHAYEQQAADYLIKQGYRLRDKNYFTRRGEIDLIMTCGCNLIFIEVRYRKHNAFGSPEESITKHKRDKIIYSAKHYISRNRLWHMNIQFDVITFSTQRGEKNLEPNWLQHAFTAD